MKNVLFTVIALCLFGSFHPLRASDGSSSQDGGQMRILCQIKRNCTQ